MNFKFTCLLPLIAMASFELSASKLLSDKVTEFNLKPQVCIVKKIGDDCDFSARVQWRTTEPMDVCLLQQQQVLQCWVDEQYVDQTIELLLQQTTLVSLIDQQQKPLATQVLQVNAIQSKKKRRRLRSAWSLF